MNRTVSGALALAGFLSVAGCGVDKSSNPLTPTVQGPIPGVNISTPSVVAPTSGAKMRVDRQPISFVVTNATTNGVRPLTYRLEIGNDAAFSTIVATTTGVTPGDGKTTLTLASPLAPEHTYFWRARAEDGANSGAFTAPADMLVFTPAVFQAPVPIAPLNTTVSSLRPTFTFGNAPMTGTTDGVNYLVEVSDSPGFGNVASASVAEQSGGKTNLDPPVDLPYDKQLYWHVRAFDSNSTGPWSATVTFRTALVGGGGGANCSYPGQPSSWTDAQWQQCFFKILSDQNAGSTVSFAGLVVTRPSLNSLGADWQNGWRGDYRPRIFLPVPNCPGPAADSPPCSFTRTVDVGNFGEPWQWIPR